MSGIANLNIEQFQSRVNRFSQRYVEDWTNWLAAAPNLRHILFGSILRKWQACRPNRMRRVQADNLHSAPYLEDLINQSVDYLNTLQNFDIRHDASFTIQTRVSLTGLWNIFEDLSYDGRSRYGRAGIVGISKSIMLLTDGKVGPAFDRRVRDHLEMRHITNSDQWFNALRIASHDIQTFEANNNTTIQNAAPFPYVGLQNGRLYDMALGPS